MRRREFITLVGGTAAAWPLAARAQQQTMPVVGFLSSSSPRPYAPMVAAFRQGLKEVGYVEGQNVAIEFGWAENDLSRLPMLAADLIRQAAVVATSGGYAPTHAAKGATATIPIVFVSAGDPVAAGLVASINRPAGNITGVNFSPGSLERSGSKSCVKSCRKLRESGCSSILPVPSASRLIWMMWGRQSGQVGSSQLLRGPSPSETSRRRLRHLSVSARTLSW